MTARQGELLPRPPRRSRGQLMGIVDARHDERATVEMQCPVCGHNTGWLRFETVTEAKRRLPCPVCNADLDPPLDDGQNVVGGVAQPGRASDS